MKILCIGDLHGVLPKIHFKDFDMIVVVGDVCSDKGFTSLKDEWVIYLEKNPEDPMSDDEFYILKIGKGRLKEMERKSLIQGRKVMEYLNSLGKPVFMVPGNWDQSYGDTKIKDMDASDYNYYKAFLDFWLGEKINPRLTKGLKNIINCQYKSNKFKGYNFIGYGLSSNAEDPFLKKERVKANYNKEEFRKLKETYQKILKKLGEEYFKRDKKSSTIFLTHNVPYNTKIDTYMNKDSEYHGKHLGSNVARWFCDKYQPLLCIGGHMHEHLGKCKIGNTTVVNVGFGAHVNTLIELKEGKIKEIKFWDGKNKYKIKK